MYITYSSNNSGGNWWLKDEDWFNLEKAGWKIEWYPLTTGYDKNGHVMIDENGLPDLFEDSCGVGIEDGRLVGALADSAYRFGLTMRQAIKEWENITGKDADAKGCSCCGSPHNFSEEGK